MSALDYDFEEDLLWLISACRGEVSISVNPHRSVYETPLEMLEHYFLQLGESTEEGVGKGVLKEIIKKNTLVHVRAYKHTPVTFHEVYHHDVRRAVFLMRKQIEGEE